MVDDGGEKDLINLLELDLEYKYATHILLVEHDDRRGAQYFVDHRLALMPKILKMSAQLRYEPSVLLHNHIKLLLKKTHA